MKNWLQSNPGPALVVAMFLSMLLGRVAGHFLLGERNLGASIGMMFGIGLAGLLTPPVRQPFKFLYFVFVLGAPACFFLMWYSANV